MTMRTLAIIVIAFVVFGVTLQYHFRAVYTEHARHEQVVADSQALSTQLNVYKSMNGVYPTTEQGLQALVVGPTASPKPSTWHQISSALPKDPWGSEYVYRCPGRIRPNKFDLFSAGSDHTPDTADDDWGD
jgi:general secretion pathway protein G